MSSPLQGELRFTCGYTGNQVGDVIEVNIYDSNYGGSSFELKGTGPGWYSKELQNVNPRNPFDTLIQKTQVTLNLWLNAKNFITDLFNSEEGQFVVEVIKNGNLNFTGFIFPDLCSYVEFEESESNNAYLYRITVVAKDFTILEGKSYELTEGRDTPIGIISDILSDFYDIEYRTRTSWIIDGTTQANDFLRQHYIERYGLRDYARSGNESDRKITLTEALERVLRYAGCRLKQADGRFFIDQITAYEDPSAVVESTYTSAGNFVTKVIASRNTTGFITTNSENNHIPGVKRANVLFDTRTATSGIQIDSQFTLKESVAESGTVSASTGSSSLSGSSTSFLSVLSEGDEIWVLQSGELAFLGEVLDVSSNTLAILTTSANFSVSGVTWHINARETAKFTQPFNGDGGQRIRLRTTARTTGNYGGLTAFARYRLRIGTYYYDSDSGWGTTEVINEFSLGTTNDPTVRSGTLTLETEDVPAAATGEIEITFFIAIISGGGIENTDSTLYEGNVFEIRDASSPTGTGLEYILEQSGNFGEETDLAKTYFGDRPIASFTDRSAISTDSTGNSFTTSDWARRGESTFRGVQRVLLREVIDFQRKTRRRISAEIKTSINFERLVSYDGKYFYILSGTYDGFTGVTTAELIEINIVPDATDNLQTRLLLSN